MLIVPYTYRESNQEISLTPQEKCYVNTDQFLHCVYTVERLLVSVQCKNGVSIYIAFFLCDDDDEDDDNVDVNKKPTVDQEER